jgi:hypothetical protein
MRTALAVILIITLSVTCVAIFVFHDLNQAAEQVVLTENVIVGDRSAADGLTVNFRNYYEHQLFWDTRSEFVGSSLQLNTEFDYLAAENNQKFEFESPGYGVGLERHYDPGEFSTDREHKGITKAYAELYHEIEAGSEVSKVIRLADYMKYYDLTISLDFGKYYNDTRSFNDTRIYEDDMDFSQHEELSAQAAVYDAFAGFFKIPVIDTEQIEISVEKSADGHVTGAGMGSAEGERFYLINYSVLTDDAAYFSFNNRTTENNIVDTSEIPGGYGIYMLPYEVTKPDDVDIKLEQLKMVYSLDESVELMDLRLSGDQKNLLIFTLEDKIFRMTVVDLNDMGTKQKIDLAELPDDNHDWFVFTDEDNVVFFHYVRSYPRSVQVLVQQDDSMYESELAVDLNSQSVIDKMGTMNTYLMSSEIVGWNGQRLAIAGEQKDLLEDYRRTGFYLIIIDSSGISFAANYYSSLSTDGNLRETAGEDAQTYSDPRSYEYNPLSLVWQNS